MANQIGGMITVSLTPFLAGQFGWKAGFRVAAMVAALGAVAWLFVDPRANLSAALAGGLAEPGLSERAVLKQRPLSEKRESSSRFWAKKGAAGIWSASAR